MDDLIKESMEGFDQLWQRVTGTGEAQAQQAPARERTYDWEDALLGFIHEEACAALLSASLARMSLGDAKAVLSRHAGEAKMRLRRLRAEHFIAAGVEDGGNEQCRAPEGRLACLRGLYLQAQDLAGRYEKAAGAVADPALGEVLSAFADASRRRVRELRALLVASF